MKQSIRTGLLALVSLSIPWHVQAQMELDSSFLPIIHFQTHGETIVDEPKVQIQMEIFDRGPGQVNRLSDLPMGYQGIVGIEYRGSSSQDLFPKKSFGFETRLLNGENRNISLLGLPRENDWVLHAPYSDKSLMRNALAYRIGESLGGYAPRTRFCEVVIDSQYRGVYLLTEKIKRDKNRVDIASLDPDDLAGDSLTGGYILKLDKFTGTAAASWRGRFGDIFQVEYPKQRDLQPAQFDYISTHMAEFEQVLASRTFMDPVEGYRAYIDLPSFVDFVLAQEITKNVDGYRLSTFIYKKRDSKGGKLYMGPIWDFNLAFGNANYCFGGAPVGWGLNFNSFCPGDFWTINPWWDRLLTDPYFVQALQTRWQELRQTLFSTETLIGYVEEMAATLGEAADRNFVRWPVLGLWVWPNEFVGEEYEAELTYLKNWIQQRLQWIDAHIASISFDVKGLYSNNFFALGPNPFSQSLTLYIRESRSGTGTLLVKDIQGRLVALETLTFQPGLEQEWQWDGYGLNGRPLSAGLYLYEFQVNGTVFRSGKLVKL